MTLSKIFRLQQEVEPTEDRVTFDSVWRFKGLERQVVIITDLEEAVQRSRASLCCYVTCQDSAHGVRHSNLCRRYVKANWQQTLTTVSGKAETDAKSGLT